ncbi:hypothetical protein B0H34DRAFT_242067 [Crassisporium funariophilum]|nr:hypothetical protein B0H34DRAFT_242067 [Crassisporium funariophilum]
MLTLPDEKPSIQVAEYVTPLRQVHVWRAAGTWTEAFVRDPQIRYLHDKQEQTPTVKTFNRVLMTPLISLWLRGNIALTVHSGAAYIIASPPTTASGPKGPVDWLVEWMVRGLSSALSGRFSSAECYKRHQEIEQKTRDAVRRAIGDRVKDMLKIMILATEPASQGHGYGGALLDGVTSLADVLGQPSMLYSSNIKNTEFYKSHGFAVVAEVVLGDKNPKWHEAPVIIRIMVREPRRQ